jgi:excisionase family DNA binding protein
MAASVTPSRLLTREQAAELLGLKPQTLALWAMRGLHLPVVKVGARAVRYRLSDLERYLQEQTVPASSK